MIKIEHCKNTTCPCHKKNMCLYHVICLHIMKGLPFTTLIKYFWRKHYRSNENIIEASHAYRIPEPFRRSDSIFQIDRHTTALLHDYRLQIHYSAMKGFIFNMSHAHSYSFCFFFFDLYLRFHCISFQFEGYISDRSIFIDTTTRIYYFTILVELDCTHSSLMDITLFSGLHVPHFHFIMLNVYVPHFISIQPLFKPSFSHLMKKLFFVLYIKKSSYRVLSNISNFFPRVSELVLFLPGNVCLPQKKIHVPMFVNAGVA